MTDGTAIEWTHRPGTRGETWNPVVGCDIVSPGCTNCYAMKMAARIEKMGTAPHYAGTTKPTKAGPVWTGKIALAPERTLLAPLRWTKPRTVFVNSMGDLFHEAIPDETIDRIFAVMALAPQHTFIVLTKRAGRMREYFADIFSDGGQFERVFNRMMFDPACSRAPSVRETCEAYGLPWRQPTCAQDWYPLSNVWLGVSVEDQRRADERIPDLLATPAAVRFVSAEPLLGPIDFHDYLVRAANGFTPPLDWIIVGGESGPDARPMHPDWARSIRDQCAAAGAAFFFKQWGGLRPKSGGRLLDGREHSAFPEARP
jgi:protein gp37